MSDSSTMGLAMIGCGTVGSGVVRILQQSSDLLTSRAGQPLQLRRVVVRDVNKDRGVDLSGCQISTDIQPILDDPAVSVALHLVGGIEPALSDITRLLKSGRDVITANKALLYEHGDELFELAGQLGRTLCFEAAVAGGIPIISMVNSSLTGNRISSIEAILNGTSNFILTRMLNEGQSYNEAVAEAQHRGYAEADPAMDVDGTDAVQKLILLTRLAFGTNVEMDCIVRQGIEHIELLDLLVAEELGFRIKLLATTRVKDGSLEVSLQPTLLKAHRGLAMTEGADNYISVSGDAIGRLTLSGAGAGQMATASAVMADIVDYATGRAQQTFQSLLRTRCNDRYSLLPADDLTRRYYLRFRVSDQPHVLADIADILGRHDISISSVRQDETRESGDQSGVARLVVLTHSTTEGNLRAADLELAKLDTLHGSRIRLPLADEPAT
ncbi:MAG: homoserine dehydrogenase [Planctomycetaceae bacterium]